MEKCLMGNCTIENPFRSKEPVVMIKTEISIEHKQSRAKSRT